MAGRASAFAALGLDPGADAAAIEQAYKRLIKQHHPDREGGDSKRAAEINRAYRELRGGKAPIDPLQFNEQLARQRRRQTWPLAALAAGGAAAALLMAAGPSVPSSLIAANHHPINKAASASDPEPMEEPLHGSAINEGVRQALSLYRNRDEIALTAASRDCQRRF